MLKLSRNDVFLDVSQLFRQRRRDGRNLRKCFPKRYFRFQQCAGPGSAFYLNFDRPNRVLEEDFKIEDNQIPWRRDQRGGLKGRGQGSAAGDLRTIGLLVRYICKKPRLSNFLIPTCPSKYAAVRLQKSKTNNSCQELQQHANPCSAKHAS